MERKFQDTLQMIAESEQMTSQKDLVTSIEKKLVQFYDQLGHSLASTAEFDTEFEKLLEKEERELFDEIVLQHEQNKRGGSVPQMQPSQVLPQQTQPIRTIRIPKLQEDFDRMYLELLKTRGKQDLEIRYRTQRSTFKALLMNDQSISQSDEIKVRYTAFPIFENYYSEIMMNFLQLPSLKTSRKEGATKVCQFLHKIVTGNDPVSVINQNTFFQQGAVIKHYYKYFKYRTIIGQQREQVCSMKKILLTFLGPILEQFQNDWLKRTGTLNLKDFLFNQYTNLKNKTNETEYEYLLQFIIEFKGCVLNHQKFRTIVMSLIMHISVELYKSPEILDTLLTSHFKFLVAISNQPSKRSYSELTDHFLQIYKSFTYPEQFNKDTFFSKIEKHVDKQILNNKRNSDLFESYFNQIGNKGLQMQCQFMKQNIKIVDNGLFKDVSDYETLWIIKAKDYFNDDLIVQVFQRKDIGRQVTEQEENKTRMYQWIDFIHKKMQTLIDCVERIKEHVPRELTFREIQSIGSSETTYQGFKLNLERIAKSCKQEDKQYIDELLDRVKMEIDLYKYMRDYYQSLASNLQTTDKKQLQIAREMFQGFHQMVLVDPGSDLQNGQQSASPPLNSLFYNPSAIFLFYYFQKENFKLVASLAEFIEKYRFIVLGLTLLHYRSRRSDHQIIKDINTIKENTCHLHDKQTPADVSFQHYSLENQYNVAQQLYLYASNCVRSYHRNKNTGTDTFNWDEPFPNPTTQGQQPHPSHLNSMKYNLSCFMAQLILSQKVEFRLFKTFEQIQRIIKYIRDMRYSQDDFKTLPEMQIVTKDLIISRLYGEVKLYKLSLEKELKTIETNYSSVYVQYSRDLTDIFAKYYSRSLIFEQVEKKKLEYKIPFSKEEIVQATKNFWSSKFSLQQGKDPQSAQVVRKQIEQLLLQMQKSERDGVDFYREIRAMIDSPTFAQDKFLKDHLPDYCKLLERYFQSIVPITATLPYPAPQIPGNQPIKPNPQRTSLIINQEALVGKIKSLKTKYGCNVTEEDQRQIVDFVQEKFLIYMKQFLGKVFREAVSQNAGDEIKLYQAQLGQPSLIENDKSGELRNKQLSDLFNNYGPKRDGDFGSQLLTTADTQPRQGQYTLADLTPVCRQKDFTELLFKFDQQQEDIMRNQIHTKKWREEKPQLQDILSKKIKRGHDLGDAIQTFFIQRIQVEKNDSDAEEEPVDETEKIRLTMSKQQKSAIDNSVTSTKMQLQNRLRNMEQNNHMVKRKEISVKTVQNVLESLPMYRRSKILYKSYLL